MLLLGTLFALFVTGFWAFCLVDVMLTPSDDFRRLPKPAWVVLVAGTFVIGALAWIAVRRPAEPTVATQRVRPGADEPRGGEDHPGNEWPRPDQLVPPRGPDDDPEFLRSLNRAIHGAEAGDDPVS